MEIFNIPVKYKEKGQRKKEEQFWHTTIYFFFRLGHWFLFFIL